MSLALFNNLGGLRFWTQEEILFREQAIQTLKGRLSAALEHLNSAWTFHRVEGPTLIPASSVSASYGNDDVFITQAEMGNEVIFLRPETTASSYAYASYLLAQGKAKAPVCVWQAGKSYRRELTDGATAAKLRYNEFYQLEFQCIYKEGTKADYRQTVENIMLPTIGNLVGANFTQRRVVPSDRLPAYSTQTNDVEVWFRNEWKEMASISTRTDFPGYVVLEVAIGLDRLVAVHFENNP